MKENTENTGPVKQTQTKDRNTPKRVASNYKVIQESMQAGLKPPWVLFDTFMREVDLIVTYKRYGKEFYEKVSFICSNFEKAFADNDLDRLVELYEELEDLKIKAAFLPS